jgi:sugar O-acyltransferase (sialic acid O-acetyltransferase NeuD family)
MKRCRLVLVGGGGHCKSCIDAIESDTRWQIAGILDIPQHVGSRLCGYEVVGTDDAIARWAQECDVSFLVTVGQIRSAALRMSLFEKIKQAIGHLAVVQASTAMVSPHAIIQQGTIVLHKAVVNAGAQIGANVIINTAAIVEHDAVVGPHAHVSTSAVVNGDACIGAGCFIGSGAVIANGISVCDGCVIGAGAVVVKPITSPGVYVGNPAKKIG